MNTMKWLLRREFWENKGGFFWTPVIIAAIFFGFTLLGVITAEVFKAHFMGSVHIGVSLEHLTSKLSEDDLARIGPMIDAAMMGYGQVIQTALGFVLFFYLLGSLYDDRRDRSILFWKSLPISDRDTVLSKVIAATLVAPLIAAAAAIALQAGVLSLMSVYVMFYGINPITVIWGPAEPLSVWVKMLSTIPVNALWSLPAVGWLMLVSAWARSKPFLWAVLVPVGAAILTNWFDLLHSFKLPDSTIWQYGVARVLGGTFPAAWQIETGAAQLAEGVEIVGMAGASSWSQIATVLGSASMWIGAAIGIAMLFAATRLRRWRDEA